MDALLQLEPTLMLIQLDRIKHQQFIVKDLAKFLPHTDPRKPILGKQQILSCSAINWIVKKVFEPGCEEQQHLIWTQFRDFILMKDTIPYKTLQIVQPSLLIFFETFEEKFGEIVNELFSDLPFNQKVLFFQTILSFRCQASQKGKTVFIRQNIEQYIGNIAIFMLQTHKSRQLFQNSRVNGLEKDALESLVRTVQFLALNDNADMLDPNSDNYWQSKKQTVSGQILAKLAINKKLMDIIQQAMMLSYRKQGTSIEYRLLRTDSIQYICNNGIQDLDTFINSCKVHAMQIQCILLDNAFDKRSTQQSFDTFHMLSVLEKQVPDIVAYLTNTNNRNQNKGSVSLNKILNNPQYHEITISLLDILYVGVKYTFLTLMYLERMKQICFEIVQPLLVSSISQLKSFQEDPKQFVDISESLIQKSRNDLFIDLDGIDENKEASVKNSAGNLLEEYVLRIDEASLYVLSIALESIQYISSRKSIETPTIKELIEKHNFKPNLQASFTIISIFTQLLKQQRKDIAFRLKDIILSNLQSVKDWSKLELSRWCLMLAYTFDYIFQQVDDRRLDVVMQIVNKLNEILSSPRQNITLIQCILEFLHEHITTLGPVGEKLWYGLLMVSDKVEESYVLEMLHNVIRKVEYQNIPDDILLDILKQMMKNIVFYIQGQIDSKIKQNKLNQKLKGDAKIYQYLKMIKSIAKAKQKSTQIEGKQTYAILSRRLVQDQFKYFFDAVFPNLSILEFSSDVIQIYCCYLESLCKGSLVNEHCFHSVRYFKKVHQQLLGFDKYLFQCYTLLLQHGYSVLSAHEVNQAELEEIQKLHSSQASHPERFREYMPKNPLAWIINNIQYIFSITDSSKEELYLYSAINLLQYVLLLYQNNVSGAIHQYFHSVMMNKYQDSSKGKQLNQWTLAALINTLFIGATVAPQHYNQSYLIVMDHSITIFKNYEAKVFSYALGGLSNNLISNLHENQKRILSQYQIGYISIITDLLKLGVRLLHFNRQMNMAKNDKQVKIKKNSPFFEGIPSHAKYRQVRTFSEKDPFNQIKKMFSNCKEKMGQSAYNSILSEIEKQLPKKQFYDLLNTVVMNQRPRLIITVKTTNL